MANISRIRVSLDGFPGGPGVSTFYCNAGDEGVTRSALGTFYGHLRDQMPTGMSYTVETAGEVIDEATGKAVSAWSNPSTYTGTSSVPATAYAQGVGSSVIWTTNAYHNGRRVRGRTFIVPIISTMYDTNGTLVDAYLGSLQTWAATLADTGLLRIYSRPPLPVPPGSVLGASFVVSGAIVRDKAATLRSRRA